jgi:hypothetical protein
MVAKFNGRPPVKNSGASKPSGEPAKPAVKKIESPYSKAKQAGGSAQLGNGIGNG